MTQSVVAQLTNSRLKGVTRFGTLGVVGLSTLDKLMYRRQSLMIGASALSV
jgi:hypothetical protein